MAHVQKPYFFFRRNGRVHLNGQGRQFSLLLAAEVCASVVVMLDTPCSEVVWRVLATHSIRQFPLHFPPPPVRHHVPSHFKWTVPIASSLITSVWFRKLFYCNTYTQLCTCAMTDLSLRCMATLYFDRKSRANSILLLQYTVRQFIWRPAHDSLLLATYICHKSTVMHHSIFYIVEQRHIEAYKMPHLQSQFPPNPTPT